METAAARQDRIGAQADHLAPNPKDLASSGMQIGGHVAVMLLAIGRRHQNTEIAADHLVGPGHHGVEAAADRAAVRRHGVDAVRTALTVLAGVPLWWFTDNGVLVVSMRATLVSGIAFSEEVFGKPLTFNHKTVFAILSWVIFAALLAGRHLRGWRGRIALRWTLAGFAALLLAYVGSRFVLEVILGR